MKSILVLLVAALSFGTASLAIGAPASQGVHRFDIPAQELGEALRVFGRASGEQLVFDEGAVRGKKSPALMGELSVEEALEQLLAGTGLKARRGDSGVWVIEGSNNSAAMSGSVQNRSSLVARVQTDTSLQDRLDTSEEVNEDAEATSLEEIVVTGSRLDQRYEGAQQVNVYTFEEIRESGQNTVAEFLNTLPSVSLAATNETTQTFGGNTTVSLRGLPVGTTLVLINGRRVQGSGSGAFYGVDFFNLNNIPLSAVERIEVIPDGSSAVYGSDGIAGVVNVILKQDIAGFEAGAQYGGAEDADEANASLAWGKQWGKVSFAIVGTYQDRGDLTNAERARTVSNDYRALGGPNRNFPYCSPGNVFSDWRTGGTTPLPGLNGATFAAVPAGHTEVPSIQEFIATAGILNECQGQLGASLIPATRRVGIFAQGRYSIRSSAELFAELMHSDIRQFQSGGELGHLFGMPGFQSYTVSASNPYNPFGTAVGIARASSDFLNSDWGTHSEFVRPLLGLKGEIRDRWNWELAAWMSKDRTYVALSNLFADSVALQNAFDSPDPAVALNPFVDGPLGPEALLQSFFSDGALRFSTEGRAVNGFVSGRLFELPAGPVEVVGGGEYGRDSLLAHFVNFPGRDPDSKISHDRNIRSMFAEARLPLLGSRPDSSNGAVLSISLAGRHDRYNDFGDTTNPQLGLVWRPSEALTVRATYAEAFKAPSLLDLFTPQVVVNDVGVVDPRTGQLVLISTIRGGNPDLEPLTGKSLTQGLTWKSKAAPGLEIAVTHWNIEEGNVIQNVFPQFIIDNEESFPGKVLRDSNGDLFQVINTAINFGRIEVTGLDYQAQYGFDTPMGRFTPSLAAVQVYRYKSQLAPGAADLDGAGEARDSNNWAPRLKGTAGVAWDFQAVSASVRGRYVGRYRDYDGTRNIGDFWLFDANFSFDAGKWLSSRVHWASGLKFDIGGVNLLDRSPHFSSYGNYFFGYDAAQEDIRGRLLYARLSLKVR